jgi:hypothetical protein
MWGGKDLLAAGVLMVDITGATEKAHAVAVELPCPPSGQWKNPAPLLADPTTLQVYSNFGI